MNNPPFEGEQPIRGRPELARYSTEQLLRTSGIHEATIGAVTDDVVGLYSVGLERSDAQYRKAGEGLTRIYVEAIYDASARPYIPELHAPSGELTWQTLVTQTSSSLQRITMDRSWGMDFTRYMLAVQYGPDMSTEPPMLGQNIKPLQLHPADLSYLFEEAEHQPPYGGLTLRDLGNRLREMNLVDRRPEVLNKRVLNALGQISFDLTFYNSIVFDVLRRKPDIDKQAMRDVTSEYRKSIGAFALGDQTAAIIMLGHTVKKLYGQQPPGREQEMWKKLSLRLANAQFDTANMVQLLKAAYMSQGNSRPSQVFEGGFRKRLQKALEPSKEPTPEVSSHARPEVEDRQSSLTGRIERHNALWGRSNSSYKSAGKGFRGLWEALASMATDDEMRAANAQHKREWATMMLSTIEQLHAFTQDTSPAQARKLFREAADAYNLLLTDCRDYDAFRKAHILTSPNLQLPVPFPMDATIRMVSGRWSDIGKVITAEWPGGNGKAVQDAVRRILKLESVKRPVPKDEAEFREAFNVTVVEQKAALRPPGPKKPENREETAPGSSDMVSADGEVNMTRLVALGRLCEQMNGEIFCLPYGWKGRGPAAYVSLIEVDDPPLSPGVATVKRQFAIIEVPRNDYATYILQDDDWPNIIKELNRSDSARHYDAGRVAHGPNPEGLAHIDKVILEIVDMRDLFAAEERDRAER